MFELIPFGRNAHLSAFDPFRDFENMERSFFSSPAPVFHTDVIDNGDAYKLECELPGFKKEDINIDIENDCLTISASRKFDNEDKSRSYIKRERFYGSVSRSFDVSGIDVEGIDAEYNDGVLALNMPKKAAAVPPTRRLEIR